MVFATALSFRVSRRHLRPSHIAYSIYIMPPSSNLSPTRLSAGTKTCPVFVKICFNELLRTQHLSISKITIFAMNICLTLISVIRSHTQTLWCGCEYLHVRPSGFLIKFSNNRRWLLRLLISRWRRGVDHRTGSRVRGYC